MSRAQIRTDLVTAVEAAKTGFSPGYTLVIEYDNRIIVDTKTQTDPFMCVKILLLDGQQIGLSDDPKHRITGQLHIQAAVPEGEGVAKANELLDWFTPRLHRKALGTVRTQMAVMAKPTPHLGWEYHTVIVPFWTDQPG